jgi:hypothetical protein
MSRTIRIPVVLEAWPCDVAAYTEDQKAEAVAIATDWLYALGGRRHGHFNTVEDRYRAPCADACGMPYKDAQGRWRNGGRGGHSCCKLPLRLQPVRAITQVRVYGEVVPSDEYTVEEGHLLRIGACWPCDDECDPAPIEVDYEWGAPFSTMGLAAIGEMACEVIRGMAGESCKLPSRAIQVSRQGVTIDMDDAQTFAENGLTGLPIADAWIRQVNPARLPQRGRVLSPDLARSV